MNKKFHVITIGGCDGEEEFEDHLVVPVSIDARKVMEGAEPTAICLALADARRIADALNAYDATS